MHCCIAHEMKKCVRYILNSKFKFNVIQYLLFVTVHLKLGKIRAGYWLLLFGLKQFFLQEKKNKGSTYYFSLFTFFFFFLTSLAQLVKNPPANAGDERDEGSIPEKGRSPGEGNSNPVQYSYLEYPMDWGVWWDSHGGAQSQTPLNTRIRRKPAQLVSVFLDFSFLLQGEINWLHVVTVSLACFLLLLLF